MKLYGTFRSLEKVDKVQVKIEGQSSGPRAYLLLDGKPHHTLYLSDSTITAAQFGVYENTPWYEVGFPGEGLEKLQEDVPAIVFETLKRLVQMVRDLIEEGGDVTVDITEDLRGTGCNLYVSSFSETTAAIYSRKLRKRS